MLREDGRVCIVGAGACGLATIKALQHTEETCSWSVEAFEKRTEVGGVWVPSHVPSPPQVPSTPLYDSLTTNLPHPIMRFTDYAFPAGTPLYPHHTVVRTYLQSYANHFSLAPSINFGCEVIRAHRLDREWEVTIRDRHGSQQRRMFDFLLVCSGHFSRPRVPTWEGLQDWKAADSSRVFEHSIYYRNPKSFSDKVVLVIGAGPSGNDISADARTVARQVFRSVRSSGLIPEDPHLKPAIARFRADGVEFEDGSVLSDVDVVVAATGYEFFFPFMEETALPPLSHHMIPPTPDGCKDPTSLFFLGAPSLVIPFPLFEFQALAVAQILAGRPIAAGSRETRHVLADGLQFAYCNALAEASGIARRVQDWVPRIYALKAVLRTIWVRLEAEGDSQRWVHGVEGVDGWRKVMEDLLDYGGQKGWVSIPSPDRRRNGSGMPLRSDGGSCVRKEGTLLE